VCGTGEGEDGGAEVQLRRVGGGGCGEEGRPQHVTASSQAAHPRMSSPSLNTSVVDPDPKGSEPFCMIRIRIIGSDPDPKGSE